MLSGHLRHSATHRKKAPRRNVPVQVLRFTSPADQSTLKHRLAFEISMQRDYGGTVFFFEAINFGRTLSAVAMFPLRSAPRFNGWAIERLATMQRPDAWRQFRRPVEAAPS